MSRLRDFEGDEQFCGTPATCEDDVVVRNDVELNHNRRKRWIRAGILLVLVASLIYVVADSFGSRHVEAGLLNFLSWVQDGMRFFCAKIYLHKIGMCTYWKLLNGVKSALDESHRPLSMKF